MRNVLSIFPDGIDTRVYFSDICLEDVPVMNTYQELIKSEKYSEASELLNNNDNITFYGAWVLNLFSNIEFTLSLIMFFSSHLFFIGSTLVAIKIFLY